MSNINNTLEYNGSNLQVNLTGAGLDASNGVSLDLTAGLKTSISDVGNSKVIGLTTTVSGQIDEMVQYITLSFGIPLRIETYAGTRYALQTAELVAATVAGDYLVSNINYRQRDAVLLGVTDEVVVLAVASATHTAEISTLNSIVANSSGDV
jgi:hypothetical protein